MVKNFIKLILLVIVFSYIETGIAQQKKARPKRGTKPVVKKQKKNGADMPYHAKYTDILTVKNVYFSRRTDPKGRGNQLEVSVEIYNNTNFPRDLYVFVIASNDHIVMKKTSFGVDMNMPDRIDTKFLVAYPYSKGNFQYKKNNKTVLKKYPKNIKKGINLETGRPYKLKERLHIRSYHLSRYRKKYIFFNTVTFLIFDDEQKLLYRQIYTIDGVRR